MKKDIPPIREALESTPPMKEERSRESRLASKLRLQRFKDDTRARKSLLLWVQWVVSIWLSAVVIILLIALLFSSASLDSSVLVSLLVTTGLAVLGLSQTALREFFK